MQIYLEYCLAKNGTQGGRSYIYLKVGDLPCQSKLSSLPTCFLFFFPIPSIAEKLERMQRDFLWGNDDGCGKNHFVNWLQVCKPLLVGRLGIRRIHKINQSLLGKFLWRFVVVDGLWKEVITTKYSIDLLGLFSSICVDPFGCSLWFKEEFSNYIKFKIGCGDRELCVLSRPL